MLKCNSAKQLQVVHCCIMLVKYYHVVKYLLCTLSLQKAVEGEVSQTLSRLYVNASRKVLDMVAREFGLKTPLYFSYTHLVCRTAKEGECVCVCARVYARARVCVCVCVCVYVLYVLQNWWSLYVET